MRECSKCHAVWSTFMASRDPNADKCHICGGDAL